jgi:hypothetical protein
MYRDEELPSVRRSDRQRSAAPRLRAARLSIFAASLLAFPTAASAERGDAPLRARIERALSAFEHVPTRAELLALSPDVETVLLEVAREAVDEARTPPLARNRAITVLRFFPSEKARAALAAVVQKNRRARPGVGLLDLEEALVSYAVVAGPRALGLVAPFLSHENEDVRSSAVDALAASRNPRAVALLSARRSIEPSGAVRLRIDLATSRQSRRAAPPRSRPKHARP